MTTIYEASYVAGGQQITAKRMYLNDPMAARGALTSLIDAIKVGTYEPVISFDLETMPIDGLEDYPGTRFDEKGEREKVSKKRYLLYAQYKWRTSFEPSALNALGLYLPAKTTVGSERKGVSAKAAWAAFYARLTELFSTAEGRAQLEAARWDASYYNHFFAANDQWLAGVEGQQEDAKQLKYREQVKRLKEIAAATEEAQFWASLESEITARIKKPIDLRLLYHLVQITLEGRFKVDPVRPGLDPFTSDVFSAQFTVRVPNSNQLMTLVLNLPKSGGMDAIKPLFALPNVEYVAQNAKFDLKLLQFGFSTAADPLHDRTKGFNAVPERIFCTRVASRLLSLGVKQSHSLAPMCDRVLGFKMDKATRDTFIGVRRDELTPAQIEYGAFDTELLFPLRDAFLKVAELRGQTELLYTFSALSPVKALTELVGFVVNQEKWLASAVEVERKRDAVATELERMLLPQSYIDAFAGVEEDTDDEEEQPTEITEDGGEVDARPNAIIRISQRELVLERVREQLGIELYSLGKDERELAETEWLKANGEPHPFFVLYKRWSKLAKLASTYGRSFLYYLHPLTGAIHFTVNIAGTDTARDSSVEPNALNLPTAKEDDDPDLRGAIEAPPGYKFLNADYSAMEQRIAADVSGDANLIALFNENGDSHSVTSALMFHRVDSPVLTEARRVTKELKIGTKVFNVEALEVPMSWDAQRIIRSIVHDKLFELDGEPATLMELIGKKYKKSTRQDAKAVGLGFMFGMSEFGIARKKNVAIEVGKHLVQLFTDAYPELAAYAVNAGKMPWENAITDEDGVRWGFSTAYGNLRRWARLPEPPSPHSFGNERAFKEAQREYYRQRSSIERTGFNTATQGGNAVIAAEAQVLLRRLGRPKGIMPFLSIYDELLALCPENVNDTYANTLLEQAMLTPSEKYIKKVPSVAEANPPSKVWVKY